jgi:hypothetical protein
LKELITQIKGSEIDPKKENMYGFGIKPWKLENF